MCEENSSEDQAEKKCKGKASRNCQMVTRKECKLVPQDKKCELVAKSVPREICEGDSGPICRNETRSVCEEVVAENCSPMPTEGVHFDQPHFNGDSFMLIGPTNPIKLIHFLSVIL